jgi:hypothetical protein
MLLRFRPVCTTCFGGGRPLTCRAIFSFVFWPTDLQAERLGDLDVESRRLLDGAGPPEDAGKRAVDSNRPTAEVRPGTMLAREWNGRMHRVAVLAEDFAWNGKTYPSLSKIALWPSRARSLRDLHPRLHRPRAGTSGLQLPRRPV